MVKKVKRTPFQDEMMGPSYTIDYKISAAYLTGEYEVYESDILYDCGIPRAKRSLKGMFFTPYDSMAEFHFCLKHTLLPALLLTSFILNPISLLYVSVSILSFIAGFFAVNQYLKSKGQDVPSVSIKAISRELGQFITDLVLSPISSLILITRTLSSLYEMKHNPKPAPIINKRP